MPRESSGRFLWATRYTYVYLKKLPDVTLQTVSTYSSWRSRDTDIMQLYSITQRMSSIIGIIQTCPCTATMLQHSAQTLHSLCQ